MPNSLLHDELKFSFEPSMSQLPINLLIIENQPGSGVSIEKYSTINEMKLNIDFASCISEARQKLTDIPIHAVVSDYFLKDGICTNLLPLPHDIPLIILLHEDNDDLELTDMKKGVTNYLMKDKKERYLKLLPFAINNAIEQKTQSDELKKYRSQLENVVEERTIELIEMYSKLQESETNFRNIFNSTNDGISIIDFDRKFVEANDAVVKQLNVSKEFLATHNMMDYIVEDYHEALYEHLRRVKEGEPSGILEVEIISPADGSILPFEINSVPIVFNQKNAILSVMRDIKERKNHARKLFETIIQTEEIERSRIARDLHDEIGPLISALKIFLTSFLESTDNNKKEKLANQMSSIVRELIESVKVISNDMSPHILVNFGIVAAIENFIDLFSKDIRISFASNIAGTRFSATVESLIYRILKELINNTIKHAQATSVFIHLEHEKNIIKCSYRDDGIGFNLKKHVESPSRGMGINNIITRIRSMGGDYEINAAPDNGFELNFTIQTIKYAGDKQETLGNHRG